jgi:hypothetical protein
MTDETTARDRAIELIENRIDRGQVRDVHLHNALRTLLPDLRALAGAPTADVAALGAKYREMAKVIEDALSDYHRYDGLGDHEEWLAETARQLRALAAAPEGVDAANERMRFVGWSVDRVDGSSSFGTFDRRESADEWCERLRGYGNDVHVVAAEVPDKPERFPRVAGRCPSCRGASLFLGAGGHVTCSRLDCPDPGVVDDQLHAEPGDEPDGMDLEAQGEMADQLAAAQAAIQRVEAVLDRHETRAREMSSAFGTTKGVRTPAWVGLVRRALDGDTTEES